MMSRSENGPFAWKTVRFKSLTSLESKQYGFQGGWGLLNEFINPKDNKLYRDNLCYLNSIVQCLFHTEGFADYFEEDWYKRHLLKKWDKGVSKEFSDLIKATLRFENRLEARKLKASVAKVNESFETRKQQDAHEFLATLRGALGEELNRAKEKDREEMKRKPEPEVSRPGDQKAIQALVIRSSTI